MDAPEAVRLGEHRNSLGRPRLVETDDLCRCCGRRKLAEVSAEDDTLDLDERLPLPSQEAAAEWMARYGSSKRR